ncbi:MAG: zf-HC2 domain-containing protein [Myxococcales bacterium]|nr:zf-HC2 domain-containing protein [Myxococcales bacterium]
MLTCQELTELVTDYLEGRMSFVKRLGFELHLGMCARCRAYLRQMKMTVRTLGKLPAEPMPAEVRQELLARFRRLGRGGPSKARGSWKACVLSALERAVGARRGWLPVATILLSLVAAVFLTGARAGPLGEGRVCLFTELAGGLLPFALVSLLAASSRSRVSPAAGAAVASFGGLAGYLLLQVTCGLTHAAPHVLAFHVGGVLLATALAAASSRAHLLWWPR